MVTLKLKKCRNAYFLAVLTHLQSFCKYNDFDKRSDFKKKTIGKNLEVKQ